MSDIKENVKNRIVALDKREYTAREVAAILGISWPSVKFYCLKLGVKKFGHTYSISNEDIENIAKNCNKLQNINQDGIGVE